MTARVKARRAAAGSTLSIPVLTGLCRAADLAIMVVISVVMALLLHRIHDAVPWGEFSIVSAISIATALMVAERQRLYDLATLLDPVRQIGRMGACLLCTSLSAALAAALLQRTGATLRDALVQPCAWSAASGAALLAFRMGLAVHLKAQRSSGRLSTRVALIGANAASLRLIEQAAGDARLTIIGIFDDRDTRLPPVAHTWIRGDVATLVKLAQSHPVDAVVIALPLTAAERIMEMRRRLAGIATDVFLASDGRPPSLAGTAAATLGATSVLPVSTRPLKDWPAFSKAAFDRVASAGLLVAALPLLIGIALLVRFDTPGPVLFRQRREGLNGEPFTMLKFRTMHCRPGMDEAVQATPNDRRVTRTGYWLRRFSLDELPQLFNVLRGDMSLVGPRPHLATTRAGNRLFSEVAPHYQARHRMKPGLTGWAQVQGLRGEVRTEQELTDRVAQDLYYIDNWSLGLDLRILAQTFLREVIVSGSGRAY